MLKEIENLSKSKTNLEIYLKNYKNRRPPISEIPENFKPDDKK